MENLHKDLMTQIRSNASKLINIIRFPSMLSSQSKKDIRSEFFKLYHYSYDTWNDMSWFGVKTLKFPFDLWVYQELIFSLKPDIIIETGTYAGGSALYFASLCDLLKKGSVITIDITHKKNRPVHKRITYVNGSSTAPHIVSQIEKKIKGKKTVLVILDSNHHKNHVLEELKIYSNFVTLGSYLIVEDTCIGHPVEPDFGPGPMEALDEFFKENTNFKIDTSREKFLISYNPRGYLLKIR